MVIGYRVLGHMCSLCLHVGYMICQAESSQEKMKLSEGRRSPCHAIRYLERINAILDVEYV